MLQRMHAGLVAGLATLVSAGCVLTPVDLTGRPCPCAQGWTCVDDVCRPRESGAVEDAGPARDAGPDARALDAGVRVDAGEDAGRVELDAGQDAGAPDTSVPPVDGGPGSTRCDDLHADAIFCDGFEWEYPSGLTGWSDDLLEAGGTVATVTSPAPFLGERVMRASSDTGPSRAGMLLTLPADDAIYDGDIWLRGMFYIPSDAAIDTLALLYVGSEDRSTGIALQARGNGIGVWIGTDDPSPPVIMQQIPRNRWACVQLHVVVAEVGGEVEVYLGDLRLGRYPGYDTLSIAADGYRSMVAGVEYAPPPQGPATVYVDEVVLSRTRVPCE